MNDVYLNKWVATHSSGTKQYTCILMCRNNVCDSRHIYLITRYNGVGKDGVMEIKIYEKITEALDGFNQKIKEKVNRGYNTNVYSEKNICNSIKKLKECLGIRYWSNLKTPIFNITDEIVDGARDFMAYSASYTILPKSGGLEFPSEKELQKEIIEKNKVDKKWGMF
jgi:predicted DNA-binding WGR domain protein